MQIFLNFRNFRSFPKATCRYTEQGNCDLTNGPRRFCLYCRLLVCRRLGLRMWGKNLVVQTNGMPYDDIPEELMEGHDDDMKTSSSSTCSSQDYLNSPASSSTSGYSSGSSIICDYPQYDPHLYFLSSESIELPTLRMVTKAFRQLDDQQKFLSAMQRGVEVLDYVSNVNDLIYMDRIQYRQLEYKFVRIACVTLNNLCNEINVNMEENAKISIFKSMSTAFSLMHKIQNSLRQFPELNCAWFSPYAGYYIDFTDLDAYLADVSNEVSVKL